MKWSENHKEHHAGKMKKYWKEEINKNERGEEGPKVAKIEKL